MPYYPYFLVQKCLTWPKIAILFPRWLPSLGVCKNQISLNLADMMQKFIEYFYFSYNSFFLKIYFGISFPWQCSVIVQRKLCLLIISNWKHWEHPYYPYFSWLKSLLFKNFEPYFIPTFLMEGTWKPVITLISVAHACYLWFCAVLKYFHSSLVSFLTLPPYTDTVGTAIALPLL